MVHWIIIPLIPGLLRMGSGVLAVPFAFSLTNGWAVSLLLLVVLLTAFTACLIGETLGPRQGSQRQRRREDPGDNLMGGVWSVCACFAERSQQRCWEF